MTIAILGGTFDPPHLGHLIAAQAALQLPGVDHVSFIPAGDPWRKTDPQPATRISQPSDAQHRLAMVTLAIAGNPAFSLDDREMRRPGSTYTVDTLEELAREGIDQPYLILGADAFADLPNWHRHDELPKLARIVIAPRPGIEPPPGYPVLDMPALAISSTDIRRRLLAGLPIRYLVPDPVISYIHHHRLYT